MQLCSSNLFVPLLWFKLNLTPSSSSSSSLSLFKRFNLYISLIIEPAKSARQKEMCIFQWTEMCVFFNTMAIHHTLLLSREVFPWLTIKQNSSKYRHHNMKKKKWEQNKQVPDASKKKEAKTQIFNVNTKLSGILDAKWNNNASILKLCHIFITKWRKKNDILLCNPLRMSDRLS